MLLPDRRLLFAAFLCLLIGIGAAATTEVSGVWLAATTAIGALATADALAGRRRRGRITVRRQLPHAMAVGTWQTVELHLSLTAGTADGWLEDNHPPGFLRSGLPLSFSLDADRDLRAAYRISINARGLHVFAGVTLRCPSPLRLWLVQETIDLVDEVRVFPNFARIAHYTLLATDHRLSQIGILQRRRRGDGMEFQQLRDYRQDDSPRRIDWQASSRVGRLIAREYQDERDQQIVFLLDCSARMRAHDGDLSHFDHALNALLLLAYVALRQGDAVGLATFGHAQPRVLPAGKSVATVKKILHAVYDLEPTLNVPDYLAASDMLTRHLHKRALVILLTNLRDEDDDTLLPAARLLRRRHALTLASLREPVLDEVAEAPVADFDAALLRGAGLEYLQARQRQSALLRNSGLHLLDTSPRELPVALINHYWARKRTGEL